MLAETKPLFQPFNWCDDDVEARLSNNTLSLYRDVICGCRTVVDLLIYDELGDDCEPCQPILSINDRSELRLMVRSTLKLLENHISVQTEKIAHTVWDKSRKETDHGTHQD